MGLVKVQKTYGSNNNKERIKNKEKQAFTQLFELCWHGTLLCWEQPSEDVIIMGWTLSSAVLSKAVAFTHAQSVIIKFPHNYWQPRLMIEGRTDPCFHVAYNKFWPYHPYVTAPRAMPRSKSSKSSFVLILVLWTLDYLNSVYMPEYMTLLPCDSLIRYLL